MTHFRIMGVVNVTPDSFSDGGRFFLRARAIKHGLRLVRDGADILDIGGESSRPGAKPVAASEEIRRVVAVVAALASRVRCPISVDTAKPEVAAAALARGARIINDITALRNGGKKMASLIVKHRASVILMHMKGNPRTMQRAPRYKNPIHEILSYLKERIRFARSCGISPGQILLDPGIGFGKTPQHNLEILRQFKALKQLGCPLVVGPSRKSFLGWILGLPVSQRLEGTLAACVEAYRHGAEIFRVHDVRAVKRTLQVSQAILS